MKAFLRQLRFLGVYGTLGVLLTLVVGLGVHLAKSPALMPWHLAPLAAEFRAADASTIRSLNDYRTLETRLMAELDAEVYAKVPADERSPINRYFAGSLADARQRKPDWNLTFELPVANPKGAVLMLHGLTDSPYSMRALAELFSARGWYVVGLRLPGHGTAPAALTDVTFEDWAAAVRMAAKDLRAKAGTDVPFVIAGYSCGAALAVEYALATLEGEPLPHAAGLVLLSPAIGVSPVAALAVWPARIAHWTGLHKLEWTDTSPEFDPYKYNGFTVNAAEQMYRVTQRIREHIDTLYKPGGVAGMPPILAFQSAADATVSAPAVVNAFFDKLAPEGHALVAFDINRDAIIDPLLTPTARNAGHNLLEGPPLPFDLTVIMNGDARALGQRAAVVARHRAAGSVTLDESPTGMSWPLDVYSLAHVALPFRPDDPVYGNTPPAHLDFMFLGKIALFGERGVLVVPPGDFARLRHNPFFSYVESRLGDFLAARER